MFNQLIPQSPQRKRKADRRIGPLTAISVASLLALLPGCVSASAPKTAASMNGEAMYTSQPWANSKPVNITARVNALQGALGAAQIASNSYLQYQQQRADAHNQRQARISAYKSHQYKMRLQAEEDARVRALLAAQNAPRTGKIKPASIVLGPAPTMADYAEDIGNSVMGYAKSMRGWIAAGHPAYEYSSRAQAHTWKPRVNPKKKD